MTFNEKVILEEFYDYNKLYFEAFGKYPTDWFSYLRWLSSQYYFVGSFTLHECKVAEWLFEEEEY